MKYSSSLPCLVAGSVWLATMTPAGFAQSTGQSLEPIPVSELGAKAGAQYQGDGLSVTPTPEGTRLRCMFLKLEGQVTPEGLWLVSTVEPQTGEKFRVAACALGREGELSTLSPHGTVSVADKVVRCARPGLTEEYSVSVDGVRQDFVVTQRPAGDAPLRLELATEARLALLAQEEPANYHMRIGPTFSDADWISMGGQHRRELRGGMERQRVGRTIASINVSPKISINRSAAFPVSVSRDDRKT